MKSVPVQKPSCWKILFVVTAAILSGCGGGKGGAAAPATSVTSNVSSAGGTISLGDTASVVIPLATVETAAAITLSQVQSERLDVEFANTTALYNLLDWEGHDIVVSGFERPPASPTDLKIKLRISDALAAKVTAATILAGILWTLDEGENEGEVNESLASAEVLPSTYDAATKTLTVEVSSIYLSDVDPLTHKPGGLKQRLTVRVGLFDTSAESVSSVAGEAGKTVLLASVGTGTESAPGCGTGEWRNPVADFRSVASFGEIRKSSTIGHGGLDLVTRDADDGPVTGLPVVAVADGYVETVISEGCAIPKKKNGPIYCDQRTNPGYALVLALNNGDRVAYRHLRQGGVQVAGLRDEPNVLKVWQDDGIRKYKVKSGQILAQSGESGKVPPHLHLEYFPKVAGVVLGHRNPLCKLAKIEAVPNSAMLKVGDAAELKVKLVNGAGSEYLIRRQKSPEVFLSGTAVARPPFKFEANSQSVMVNVEKSVADENIAKFNPAFIASWPDPSDKIQSNNAVEEIQALQPGTTQVSFVPSFLWSRNRPYVPFGAAINVPVSVAPPSNPLPSVMQQAFWISDSGTIPCTPYSCRYQKLQNIVFHCLTIVDCPTTVRIEYLISTYSWDGVSFVSLPPRSESEVLPLRYGPYDPIKPPNWSTSREYATEDVTGFYVSGNISDGSFVVGGVKGINLPTVANYSVVTYKIFDSAGKVLKEGIFGRRNAVAQETCPTSTYVDCLRLAYDDATP